MVNMNRILLAEDNDDLRELITDFLSEHGFDVYAVVDGEDAWEAVQTTRYQLVLLDVMMPGMDLLFAEKSGNGNRCRCFS